MGNYVQKVAAVHDISGVGRCSMTVILPILSALGCQVCPLPTAILSSHSEYREFFFYDFTERMEEYHRSWLKNSEEFDCIYTGFIGSEKQINIIIDIIDESKVNRKPIIVVDPVMGDHGVTYKTYTDDMIKKMSYLVKKADVITPNLTETCILLNQEYTAEAISIETIKKYLDNLSDMGPEIVVLTGVKTEDGEHINAAYDRKSNIYWKIPFEHIDAKYPGTGDLFTSLFVGHMLNGKKIPEAIQEAARFVTLAVSVTHKAGTPKREGVLFEKIMHKLYDPMTEYCYENM